jgi:hypothetical protein
LHEHHSRLSEALDASAIQVQQGVLDQPKYTTEQIEKRPSLKKRVVTCVYSPVIMVSSNPNPIPKPKMGTEHWALIVGIIALIVSGAALRIHDTRWQTLACSVI